MSALLLLRPSCDRKGFPPAAPPSSLALLAPLRGVRTRIERRRPVLAGDPVDCTLKPTPPRTPDAAPEATSEPSSGAVLLAAVLLPPWVVDSKLRAEPAVCGCAEDDAVATPPALWPPPNPGPPLVTLALAPRRSSSPLAADAAELAPLWVVRE